MVSVNSSVHEICHLSTRFV